MTSQAASAGAVPPTTSDHGPRARHTARASSGGRLDIEVTAREGGEARTEIVDEVVASRSVGAVVPQVVPLVRVVLEAVQLAFGTVVLDVDRLHERLAEEHANHLVLLEPIRLSARRRLVRRAQPPVPDDRAEVH